MFWLSFGVIHRLIRHSAESENLAGEQKSTVRDSNGVCVFRCFLLQQHSKTERTLLRVLDFDTRMSLTVAGKAQQGDFSF